MANGQTGSPTRPLLNATQQISYDPEVDPYFPAILGNPPVSPRDTSKHFTPQVIRSFAKEGLVPYILDSTSGKVTFAMDNTLHENVSPADFRVRFSEFFRSISPDLKKLFADDSNFNFEYFPPSTIQKLAEYVANPELIVAYNNQRGIERALNNGIINDQEANDFVKHLLNWAIQERASDIHFESMGGLERRIRIRVDGKLRVCESKCSSDLYNKAIVILKNGCGSGVKLDERRRPQDGQYTFISNTANMEGKANIYDLRAAFRPVVGMEESKRDREKEGEKTTYAGTENVTLRIAHRNAFKTSDQLGLSDYDHKRIKQVCAEPNGIILLTGPTGSGKTTTLYSILHNLNDPSKKIVTIEDPVEVQMPGLQQTQFNAQTGITFANFLRGALRTDPDVIFVGEIRDSETTQAAIEASMTGHLVLSSLHTNDAPGAISRLLDLGAARYMLASTVRGVMAQTLVPVFEANLRKRIISGKFNADDVNILTHFFGGEALNELMGEQYYPVDSLMFYDGKEKAFSGRQVLSEFWLVDKKSQDVILDKNAGPSALTEIAEQSGMRPMFISGVEKAKEGITSLEAVLDSVGQIVFREKREILKRYIQP